MNRRKIILPALAALTACVAILALWPSRADTAIAKYTLYIGTADKDTGLVEIPYDDARAVIIDVCQAYAAGLTLLESDGVWLDGDGVMVSEPSYVLIMLDIAEQHVQGIVSELRVALNQQSILVEKSLVTLSW